MKSESGHKRRNVIAIVIALLVLVAASGVAEYFLYRSRSNAGKVEEYHQDVTGDWVKLFKQSESVDAAFTRVDSPEDFGNVASAAGSMRKEIQGVLAARGEDPPPPGERDLAKAETECLESLNSYLETVEELASGDEAGITKDRALLENHAAQALSKVNDFLFKARFIVGQIPGGFFRAGESLANAYRPPDWQSAEEEVAYGVVCTFMDADIREFNPDVLFSLSSSRRIEVLTILGVTREHFVEIWTQAWEEDDKPVDFYVSRRGIVFTDPSTVEVEAIVYLESGDIRKEKVRLVREAEGWKVEGYPFVGWY